MSQKSLIQLIIVLIIILITSAVYLNYFVKDPKDLVIKIKTLKTENIKDETSNYIENISYISKIGENLIIRRSNFISITNGFIGVYVHNVEKDLMGKIGVLISVETNIEFPVINDFLTVFL